MIKTCAHFVKLSRFVLKHDLTILAPFIFIIKLPFFVCFDKNMRTTCQIRKVCFKTWFFISCIDFPTKGLILQKCVFTQTFPHVWSVTFWNLFNQFNKRSPYHKSSSSWRSLLDHKNYFRYILLIYSLLSFEVNLPKSCDQRIWVALNVLSRGWYEVFCCLGLTKPCILEGHF